MQFRDEYDIPEELVKEPCSPAFTQFLRHWFVGSIGVIRGEVDLSFLKDLTPKEISAARQLLRRNLSLKYTHIIDGSAILDDATAVPMLREMLVSETDLSRRLVVTGALWKLARDGSFVDCLNEMKSSNNATLKQAHIHQILWLGDERSIDLLIDLLEDEDEFVRFLALESLNSLEFGRSFLGFSKADLPRQSSDYEKRRHDQALRERMVSHLPWPETKWK